MGLTQISTNGVKTNTLTSDDIASSAITVSELAVDAVEDDRIKTLNNPSAGKFLQYKNASEKMQWADAASEGTEIKSTGESGTTKFLRTDGDGTSSWQVPPVTDVSGKADLSGATFTGDVVFDGETENKDITFDRSENWLKFNDDTKAVFGTSANTTLFHNGTDLYIQNGAGDIRFQANAGEDSIYAKRDGAVELWHGAGVASKKFETTATGINVTGAINVNGSPLSSAPTLDLVADGAITANKPVAVQSDGKIKEIKEFAVSASNGSATIIDGSQGQSSMVNDSCKVGDNKFVTIWVADNDSDKLYAACHTVSGTTITSGTPVVVASSDAIDERCHCAYDAQSDALLVMWITGSGGSAYVKMRAASISGTSLTFGTELSEAHNSATVLDVCSDQKGGFLAAWTGNYASAMQAYTVSGNTITKGSTSTSNLRSDFRPYRGAVSITYNKDDGTYIVGWCADGGDMYGIVSTVTGTSISNGGAQGLGNANNKMLQLAYDEENKQVFCVYYESNKLYGNIWSISGNGISKANDTSFGNENPQAFRVDYNPDVGKAIVLIRDGNGSTAQKLSWAEITNNSGTPAKGSYTQVWSNESAQINISYIGKGKFVTVWRGTSEHAYGTIWQRAFTDSTLTEGYIGFSSAAINDTATGTIAVVGNTNSSQSGLTAGKKYYVTRTGGLSTAAATPSVEAGTAVSSTKLLIKG